MGSRYVFPKLSISVCGELFFLLFYRQVPGLMGWSRSSFHHLSPSSQACLLYTLEVHSTALLIQSLLASHESHLPARTHVCLVVKETGARSRHVQINERVNPAVLSIHLCHVVRRSLVLLIGEAFLVVRRSLVLLIGEAFLYIKLL